VTIARAGHDIVPLAEQHIEGFHAVLDSVACEGKYLAFLGAPPLEKVRKFVHAQREQRLPQFVALVDGQVVGWCDISSLNRPLFAHSGVLGIGILAEYRGCGIGEALLRATLDEAKVRGLTRVELTVREKNVGAAALYRKLGFEVEGVKRQAVKHGDAYEDLICMAVLF
jgi:ribosomal protein S18 acetylase RimI-like enzyme